MLQWFLDLNPLYRILTLAVVVFFLIFAVPSEKVNFRNLLKALLFLMAALLIYFLWSGEDPDSTMKRFSQSPSAEETLPSVPKYYEDPEKRWGDNR